MTEDALPEVPGYRFEAKLAEGGMGVVYRAVDDTLGRTVAIKMIRSALLGRDDEEEETVARFLREARAAAQIRSNHVAHVLQFGRTDAGDLFLVLEYLDGTTLADLLRREKRISVERAVRITRQICRGMEAAHQLGIVHRDLKPSNVMLVDQDGDPEFVKILDFGVAKVVGERESGVTRAGMLVGTYTCMAPEQVTNETIDARTDVYALAVLLFRLLTGRALFEGGDVTAVLFHHVHTPAPAPSKVAPDAAIPSALDAVVLRCLEKQPSRRPRSMADLDRALGLSLELDTNADAVLQQAPTAISSQHDETRTHHGTLTAEGPISLDLSGEAVFAEGGPVRKVDPRATTQITNSRALPTPAHGDPPTPTPRTSTSTKQPASLAPLSPVDEPLPEAPVSPSAPAAAASPRKPLAAVAAGVVALLLVAIGVVALASGEEEPDEVVVVVSPPAAERAAAVVAPSPPDPPPAEGATEGDEEEPQPASDEAIPSEDEAPTPSSPEVQVADTKPASPPSAASRDDEAQTRREVRRQSRSSSANSASATKERAQDQRKRRAARKRADQPKAASTPEPAEDDDKKPRSRFIRVHTGDTDG